MVPHLVTALTGPINELEQRILESTPVIERWFRLEWMEHTPPFWQLGRHPQRRLQARAGRHQPLPRRLEQPDARDAAAGGAGRNGRDREDLPEAKNLLLVPENHTRNMFYLMNVAQLQKIFYQAGLNVRLGR